LLRGPVLRPRGGSCSKLEPFVNRATSSRAGEGWTALSRSARRKRIDPDYAVARARLRWTASTAAWALAVEGAERRWRAGANSFAEAQWKNDRLVRGGSRAAMALTRTRRERRRRGTPSTERLEGAGTIQGRAAPTRAANISRRARELGRDGRPGRALPQRSKKKSMAFVRGAGRQGLHDACAWRSTP